MKTLSIKNIIEFRKKVDRSKKKFVTDLKIDKIKTDKEGGGNYWVSCLTAISSSYKSDDLECIVDRRVELEDKYRKTGYERTKTMYRRNIDILCNFKGSGLKKWRPSKKMKFLKKDKESSVLIIKGLQVQATPHHVFTFEKDGTQHIGAIWFVAKLKGYRKEELGMFTDILHHYLDIRFSKDYGISSKYCIAVDVVNNIEVDYSELENEKIPSILSSTLDEIKELM